MDGFAPRLEVGTPTFGGRSIRFLVGGRKISTPELSVTQHKSHSHAEALFKRNIKRPKSAVLVHMNGI